MAPSLKDRTVLVVGRDGGLARAVALSANEAGAHVVAAGRNQAALESAYEGLSITDEYVDLTDEASIDALGQRLGAVDHVVSTASARARGHLADLDHEAVRLAFETKVIGPIMLAKHLVPRMPQDGSLVFFSGATAVKPAVGSLAVAGTNGAVDSVIRTLAVELGPLRVNAIQGRTLPGHVGPEPGPADRHRRRRRPSRAVRPDQHLPDRRHPGHRRRRNFDLITAGTNGDGRASAR